MSRSLNRPQLIVRTFMTHEMRDEDIAALSTGREEEFLRIMNAIERSAKASPGPLQHIVLYGARGFGKSFMTRRIQISIGSLSPDCGQVLYVLLPEEQHNLQRSPHAFLDTIRHKLNSLHGTADEAFEASLFQWPTPGEEVRRWNEAAAELESAVDAAFAGGKGLVVVVVENFDSLLATLFRQDEDEQRLRLWLDRPGNRMMLIATATGTVDIDYERPLFKALEPVRLSPWSQQDCIDYFNNLREHEGRPHLTPEQEAKARAISDFIGGTPRLAQLLAEVIDTQDALTVAETMSALADRLAEYYRRRIEDLPPLARGLLDALIRGGEPASQTELAERVGARGQSDIARVMSDLQRADVVRGRRSLDSREVLYSVTDRVFVHYYRLRQGSRVARATPLSTILDFLKAFYSPEERREQALAHLDAGRPAEAALFSSLALEGQTPADENYSDAFLTRWQIYVSTLPAREREMGDIGARILDDPAGAFGSCSGVEHPSAVQAAILAVARAQAVYRLGAAVRAKETLIAASESADGPLARTIVSTELMIFLSHVEDNSIAAADAGQATSADAQDDNVPDPLTFLFLQNLTSVLVDGNRLVDALDLLLTAMNAARDSANETSELAFTTHAILVSGFLGRHDAVLELGPRGAELAHALDVPAAQAAIQWQRAMAARSKGDFAGTVAFADEALTLTDRPELSRIAIEALREKAKALTQLGKLRKAKEACEKGISLATAEKDMDVKANLLAWLSHVLNSMRAYRKGEAAATEAIELARAVGDRSIEVQALANRLHARIFTNKYDEALEDAEAVRALDNPVAIITAASVSTVIGTHLPLPLVVDRYAEALDLAATASQDGIETLPWPFLTDALAAAARANHFAALDAALANHLPRLRESKLGLKFDRRNGAVIATVAESDGRAAGFETAANLLSRIAALMASLDPAARDPLWLPKIITGFASACRDPGLLKDVATLLTSELDPEAELAAQILLDVAKMDESDDPERVLARLDPDKATLLRRLRGLPEPTEKGSPSRRGRPKRGSRAKGSAA